MSVEAPEREAAGLEDAGERGLAPGTGLRYAVALVLGGLGALLIWLVSPYSNFVIGNPLVADDYLPAVVVLLLLVVLLGINPLLWKFSPRHALQSPQLAVLLTILLVACVPISTGYLRFIPYTMARTVERVSQDQNAAEAHGEEIAESLYPDPIGFGEAAPNAKTFLLELNPGESVPWSSWVGPAVAWGFFALFWWVMLMGLAMIVFPQWRNNERLQFPLLSLFQSLLETPREGHLYADLFRNWRFWMAVGAVFLIHLMTGINFYDETLVPGFPLTFDLNDYFAEAPWRDMPGYVKTGRIYFVFLGVAFLMSNRIGFSIWGFAIGYALYRMIGWNLFPPHSDGTVADHRTGAMIAFTLGILWLGRAHWRGVLLACVGMRQDEETARDRFAGFLFATGFIGLVSWIFWAGADLHWAALYVVLMVMYAILLTRIVAETGLALVGLEGEHIHDIVNRFPVGWFTPASAFLGGIVAMISGATSRMNLAVVGTHVLGLYRNIKPTREIRVALAVIGLLMLGLYVGGMVHLNMGYHHSVTLNGLEQPINSHGTMAVDSAFGLAIDRNRGAWNLPAHNQVFHMAFGFFFALALQWACMMFPKFPLHPVGLIIVSTWYMEQVWFSVFLGWALKSLIVRYGGARLYTGARPVFLGLIVGEVLAAAFWAIVPVFLIWMGHTYRVVQVLPF